MGRNTQGVRLANLKDSYLVAVQRIGASEEEDLEEVVVEQEAEESAREPAVEQPEPVSEQVEPEGESE